METFVKTQRQISCMKRAAQIIDNAYDALLGFVREGMTERELAAFIEGFVRGNGGSGLSFDTIVAFGAGGAEPHHVPTDKKLEKGVLVTVDMGAVYDGFCSDFTRTFAFGEVGEKQREIYRIVYEAQKLGVAAAKKGISCCNLDSVCRDYIEKCGYGEFFIHTTGHGVGELIHEPPTIGRKTPPEVALEDNMVITIEPGIYITGEMGVRIEDMVVVGREGVLSRIPTELVVVG